MLIINLASMKNTCGINNKNIMNNRKNLKIILQMKSKYIVKYLIKKKMYS